MFSNYRAHKYSCFINKDIIFTVLVRELNRKNLYWSTMLCRCKMSSSNEILFLSKTFIITVTILKTRCGCLLFVKGPWLQLLVFQISLFPRNYFFNRKLHWFITNDPVFPLVEPGGKAVVTMECVRKRETSNHVSLSLNLFNSHQ